MIWYLVQENELFRQTVQSSQGSWGKSRIPNNPVLTERRLMKENWQERQEGRGHIMKTFLHYKKISLILVSEERRVATEFYNRAWCVYSRWGSPMLWAQRQVCQATDEGCRKSGLILPHALCTWVAGCSTRRGKVHFLCNPWVKGMLLWNVFRDQEIWSP